MQDAAQFTIDFKHFGSTEWFTALRLGTFADIDAAINSAVEMFDGYCDWWVRPAVAADFA